jgi:hypothetical protein
MNQIDIGQSQASLAVLDTGFSAQVERASLSIKPEVFFI